MEEQQVYSPYLFDFFVFFVVLGGLTAAFPFLLTAPYIKKLLH